MYQITPKSKNNKHQKFSQFKAISFLMPSFLLTACDSESGGKTNDSADGGDVVIHNGDFGNNLFYNVDLNDIVNAGDGIDHVIFDLSKYNNGVTIDLTGNNNNWWNGVESFSGLFTNKDDIIIGRVILANIDGGDGIDKIYLDYSSAIIESNPQVYKLYFHKITNGVSVTYNPAGGSIADRIKFNIENFEEFNIIGTNTSDYIYTYNVGNFSDYIEGRGGDDYISTGNGNDIVKGGTGGDQIYAGDGNDIIYGEEGNDALYGQGGDDILDGGKDADYLRGGDGNDIFKFLAGDSKITIGGSGDAGTIFGYDRILDIKLGDGTNGSEIYEIIGNQTIVSNGTTNGDNSTLTINGEEVNSHTVAEGIITFTDAGVLTTQIEITSNAEVAAVIEYLHAQDLGAEGATVAFDVGLDTYIYTQGSESGANNDLDIIVQLEGVQVDSLVLVDGTSYGDLLLV
ncbi:MAG: hypothetical protein OCD03_16375 [Hyphomicrobiales bacterium]